MEKTPNKFFQGYWCKTCDRCKNGAILLSEHPLGKYYRSDNKYPISDYTTGSHKDQEVFFDCPSCGGIYSVRNIRDVISGKTKCPCNTTIFTKKEPENVSRVLSPKKDERLSDKVEYKCKDCKHKWFREIKTRSGCPFCSHQKLCDEPSCKMCYENSFASDERNKFWSKKNEKTPRQVFKSSNKNYFFDCDDCSHTFSMYPRMVVSGRWCSYCSHKVLCKEDCSICSKKAFSGHWRSKYLIDGQKSASQIFMSEKTKYQFKCENGKNHPNFWQTPSNIVHAGNGCPKCAEEIHVSETRFLAWLQKNYPDEIIETQVSFPWCEYKKPLRFDFSFKDRKLLIELDGIQHYEQVKYFGNMLETIKARDKIKNEQSTIHGYKLIRVYQPDFFFDKNNWDTLMKKEIDSWIS